MAGSVPEEAMLVDDAYKRAFIDLLDGFLPLGENAEIIVRSLKKTADADVRSKLIRELRDLESSRLEFLDQMDDFTKST